MKKNILIIGGGGREHALAWRLKQSPSIGKLFCAPGNAGIAEDVECVSLPTNDEIWGFCRKHAIDLVVIGPEQPLVDGMSDRLRDFGIIVFGPSQKAATLEGSKVFMKELCKKYHIPTAAYGSFTDAKSAKAFLQGKAYPIVVKADGLAAGKGVVIAVNAREAESAIDDMMNGQFGESGKKLVIEEFLDGEEVSFFALSDGETAREFGHAQDHKRVGDGDKGPNTGGMGTYSPLPLMSDALRETVMQTIILPTVAAMRAEGMPYLGVLFAGLMITETGPKLIEYNVRFGDPETQSLMMRFNGDLAQALHACATGDLQNADLSFDARPALCVVMASEGYPAAYEKGTLIRGLDKANDMSDVKVFHAGTEKKGDDFAAAGGRVLGVCALGETLKDAQQKAYAAVDVIDWPEGFCRRDIGWRSIR